MLTSVIVDSTPFDMEINPRESMERITLMIKIKSKENLFLNSWFESLHKRFWYEPKDINHTIYFNEDVKKRLSKLSKDVSIYATLKKNEVWLL